MNSLEKTKIGKHIAVLTDYHSNGSYETLKNNVLLRYEPHYAIMIRTLNFERNDFHDDLIYVDKDAYEHLAKSKVFPNDIFINKIANPGNVYIIPDLQCPVTCGMNLFLIRFSSSVNQRYMYYCMKYYESDIKALAHGTTTKTITKDEIRDVEIVMHTDISEQNAIEAILTSIDLKIQNNIRINDNLQQQIKLIYDYWFNQFAFPDRNGKPYSENGGAMRFDESLKRDIPVSWTVKSFTDNNLFSILCPGVDVFETKTYYATAEINGTSISEGNVVDFATRESRANMQPRVNSVWFAKMKNSIKHLYLNQAMGEFINNAILSTGFCGLQCTESSFEYVASFIEHSYFETIKDVLAHGATQEAVNNDDLSNICVVVPDDNTLNRYHEATKSIFEKMSMNICENQRLIRLRDWLLPMLMNGQLTITD